MFWYSAANDARCSEVCDAHFCVVQVSKYKVSEDGNLSTCQTVKTAADESEVRGYIFRFLEPLSHLASELGLRNRLSLCVVKQARIHVSMQSLST